MSDQSGASDSDLDRYEHQHHSDSDGDGSRKDSTEDRESDSDDEGDDEKDIPIKDVSSLKLCPDHKGGEMTNDCDSCKSALSLITNKNTVKLLTQNSTKSSLVSRYMGRCDDTVPTLVLDSATVEIAKNTFTKGVFKDKKSWTDVVKKYLTLPKDQHDALCRDIKTEDALRKFRNEKRFQYIFKFEKEVLDSLKNLRLAQRPLLALIGKTNACIESVRKLGDDAGLMYPEIAPERTGGDVPRDGHKLTDTLHVSSHQDIFPRPDVTALVFSAGLNEDQTNHVIDFVNEYRGSLSKQYMELFTATSGFLNTVEDNLVFYTDLYSHADASFRDLIREKLASLFKPDVKTDVVKKTSSRQLTEKPSGLFGGSCIS